MVAKKKTSQQDLSKKSGTSPKAGKAGNDGKKVSKPSKNAGVVKSKKAVKSAKIVKPRKTASKTFKTKKHVEQSPGSSQSSLNWSEGLLTFFSVTTEVIKEKIKNLSLSKLAKFFKAFFFEDLILKFMSVIMALSIYGYVKLQNIEERSVTIPLDISKVEELAFVSNPPDSVTLFLSGTRNQLSEIDVNQIKAHIDMSEVFEEGIYKRTPTIDGVPTSITVINFVPKEVEFELSSLQRKLLPIEPELVGKPNREFEIKNFKTSPRKIWIFGPEDILEDITKLNTEPIEVKNIKADKETEVQLNRNIHPNIRVDMDRKIKVNIYVVSKFFKETLRDFYPVTIEIDNPNLILGDIYYVSNVSYQVPVEDSEEFDPFENIQFFVDTSSISAPGTYKLPVKYKKVNGLKIREFSPKKLEIQVEEVLDDTQDTEEQEGEFLNAGGDNADQIDEQADSSSAE